MSEIAHIAEFSPPPPGDARESAKARALAGNYAAVFLGSDAGKAVLLDLLTKFPTAAPRFPSVGSGPCQDWEPAKIDGQATVMREIVAAVKAGASKLGHALPDFLKLL